MWRVGTVVALHDETSTARTITLEVPDWPSHLAGQHVDVRLTASDGYSAVRSYSIASAPNPAKRVEITVERLPNGEVSPYLTQQVSVGDHLELRVPIGGWFVSAKHTRMSKPCGNPPRHAGVVPRRVVRSTNPVRPGRLHRTSENRPSHAASVLEGCLLSRDPLEGAGPSLENERYLLRAS